LGSSVVWPEAVKETMAATMPAMSSPRSTGRVLLLRLAMRKPPCKVEIHILAGLHAVIRGIAWPVMKLIDQEYHIEGMGKVEYNV
jgi:hypothetical protein